MQAFEINVTEIEELQTIANLHALDKIFTRAKQTIVGGEKVILVRKTGSATQKFDEISTPEDLEAYKKGVYKYL